MSTTSSRTRRSLLLLAALLPCIAAGDARYQWGGHTKLRAVGATFPVDSVLRPVAGSDAFDLEGDLRLNFSAAAGRFEADAEWQLVGLYGDRVEYSRELPAEVELFAPRLPSDDRRFFDFTKVLRDEGRSAWLQRLDRLWAGYSSEHFVARLGRQAITWGNGLFYAPMDLVNPFDPATVDTEYKAGDDMLYAQYLRRNGHDLQGAGVVRRDPVTGDVDGDEATVALKYHGFGGESEYDLLVAEHYGDPVVGIGASRSLGGAILRGDVVVTDTALDTRVQLVANWSYSWTALGRNMSGAVEYYFNGFGQHGSRYDPQSLAGNPDLLRKIARGDSFALGRHYLAASVLIEMSALWTVTPTVLANVGDPSALLQINTNLSLSDNATLLGSVGVPIGPSGSEFGGIESTVDGRYLSTGANLFLQVAWYF